MLAITRFLIANEMVVKLGMAVIGKVGARSGLGLEMGSEGGDTGSQTVVVDISYSDSTIVSMFDSIASVILLHDRVLGFISLPPSPAAYHNTDRRAAVECLGQRAP